MEYNAIFQYMNTRNTPHCRLIDMSFISYIYFLSSSYFEIPCSLWSTIVLAQDSSLHLHLSTLLFPCLLTPFQALLVTTPLSVSEIKFKIFQIYMSNIICLSMSELCHISSKVFKRMPCLHMYNLSHCDHCAEERHTQCASTDWHHVTI